MADPFLQQEKYDQDNEPGERDEGGFDAVGADEIEPRATSGRKHALTPAQRSQAAPAHEEERSGRDGALG